MTANTVKRRVLFQSEIYRMGKLLEEHLLITDQQKLIEPKERIIEYKNGFDDDKIASLVAPDLTGDHTKTFRQNVFGKLRTNTPGDNNESRRRYKELLNEIDEMKQIVTILVNQDSQNRELITKFNLLCDCIAIARGSAVDCRHLKIKVEG